MNTESFPASFLSVDRTQFRPDAKTRTCFHPVAWGLMVLTLVFASAGYAVPINILDAQFTTAVSMQDIVGGPDFSRSLASASAISDSLFYSGGGVVANANANLFGVSATTSAFPAPPEFIGHSSAFTESDLWFSPSTSQTTTLNIQFAVDMVHFTFTSGNVCLMDVTSGIELWSYGWGSGTNGFPSGVDNGTPITFDLTGMTTLMLSADLNQSDVYKLSMRAGSNAAADFENESIQLFGLEPVPEPSTFALIGLGSLALVAGRWHARFPRQQRPDA